MSLDLESFELLRAAVQRFVLEKLIPAENFVEANDEVPAALIEDMKQMGLFGLSISETYGSFGVRHGATCVE